MPSRNVLFFDFETTDVDASSCGVVDAACQLVRYSEDGSIEAEQAWSAKMNPGKTISPEASQYHGIIDADVVDLPKQEDALKPMADLVKYAHYVAGHNINTFDVPVATRLVTEEFNKKPALDTLRLARKQWRGIPEHKLGALAYRFSLFDLTDKSLRLKSHGAEFDVTLCRNLFELICKERGMSVDEVYKWMFIVEPATHFSFGKYKGWSIAEIYEYDSSVLEWYLKGDWFSEEYPEEHLGVLAEFERRGHQSKHR